MAKWGQGDPRWIVEERADATNVNNWHWTERDATSWSRRKLEQLLVGLAVEGAAGRCEIRELKRVDGEAACNSRKGKLIFFYEWNIELGWTEHEEYGSPYVDQMDTAREKSDSGNVKHECSTSRNNTSSKTQVTTKIRSVNAGTMKESGEKHEGSVEIPNLSEENEVDDTEISVSKKEGDGDMLKDFMRTEGTSKVRQALRDYLKALKTEFTLGMILPTKTSAGQELAVKKKSSEKNMQDSVLPVSLDTIGVRIPTVKILLKDMFDSPAEELYSIFTTKELVQKFSKSCAVIEAKRGGKLQMFDGCVTGEYVELLPSQRITMKWRCRNWPYEHYATVALNFKDQATQTELQLECKGVPVCNEDSTRHCWQKQHFEEIHVLLQQTKVNAE